MTDLNVLVVRRNTEELRIIVRRSTSIIADRTHRLSVAMSDRSLSSLGLPIATLSALERFGYDTVSDLSKSTPEDLSRGMFYRAVNLLIC